MRQKGEIVQELSESIEKVAEGKEFNPISSLQETAQKWANHSLKTYRGKLLNDALKISEALSNFVGELENPQ